MFGVQRQELCKFFKQTLQDNNTGKYSHAKVIAMCGFLAATVFIWKLIIIGGMSAEYFMIYVAYCTGHQTINKFLDGKTKDGTVD